MTTNPGHDPLPDTYEAQPVTLPFFQTDTSTGDSEFRSDESAPEKSWKPTFDRRHSWSNEDRKHELQERLLGSEKGNVQGFTEAHSGI